MFYVMMEWFINGEVCVFQTCLSVQTSSWHISVSVWLTDAPWARRGLRLRSKYARGNGQVRLHVWDELARTDWQRVTVITISNLFLTCQSLACPSCLAAPRDKSIYQSALSLTHCKHDIHLERHPLDCHFGLVREVLIWSDTHRSAQQDYPETPAAV